MLYPLLWYLVISFVGLLTFPLAFRLFPALADRGYTLARILGLLLWGFFFWFLASLGILKNDPGGLVFALLVVLALSVWAWRGISRVDLLAWWKDQRRSVIISELVFLLAFAAWTFVRSANPEIAGTEKPMEMAFIDAIMHSPAFPPHDPWLSGYAISYYYFGYVMVAMLAEITVTPGSIAFNLGLSLVFALSAVGAYGLVYNLLSFWRKREGNQADQPARRRAPSARAGSSAALHALLGPFFLLIVSNLEGFLHSLHNRGVFWSQSSTGGMTSAFWTWLDMKELSQPPSLPLSWVPTQFWWWWRASRVVQDYDLAGNWKEVIDEFPFFSYLLGDLHPHVLAMPFAILAIGLALNLFLGGGKGRLTWFRQRFNLRSAAWGVVILLVGGLFLFTVGLSGFKLGFSALGLSGVVLGAALFPRISASLRNRGLGLLLHKHDEVLAVGLPLYIGPTYFLFSTLILGGMAFLNTWDFPIYVGLFCGAYFFGRWRELAVVEPGEPNEAVLRSPIVQLIKEFFLLGIALGIGGVLFYLPFYLGFSSQAGGIMPNLINPTRGAHFWVMFGSLLLPIFAYLVYVWKQDGDGARLKKGLILSTGLLLGLWVLDLLLSWVIANLPVLGDLFLNNLGAPGQLGLALQDAFARRFIYPGGWITLLILFGVTAGLIWPRLKHDQAPTASQDEEVGEGFPPERHVFTLAPAHLFVLLLVIFGALITIAPEFFYLRDQFGTRMNTIFKFYYQAWIMWSVAAAFGTAVLLEQVHGRWGVVYNLGLVLVIGASLVYPVFSLWNKTDGFNPPGGLTLDGAAYYAAQNPDDMAAIHWLSKAPPGVVVEAVGNSYSPSFHARVSTFSGQPTVLGWPGHESQWRGGSTEMGNRQEDVDTIYRSSDWKTVQELLNKYQVRYVYVGPLERSTYRVSDTKFTRYLNVVYQQGQVTIYEVPQGTR
jgi:uncharacterized membrane protein